MEYFLSIANIHRKLAIVKFLIKNGGKIEQLNYNSNNLEDLIRIIYVGNSNQKSLFHFIVCLGILGLSYN